MSGSSAGGAASVTEPAVHGPRRWLGLVSTVILVFAGVVYAVEDRERDAERSPVVSTATPTGEPAQPSPSADASRARRIAVDAILWRRAEAITTADESQFLQDLDPADAVLREEQKVLFANLRQIGFREVYYSQADERFDPVVTRRRGPSAYLVRVLMHYQIPGVDRTPVQTELGYTFVERGGRWLLADDDDLDADLGPGAHREPWDLGRIEVHRGPRALVLVEKGDTRRARSIVSEAAEALAEVAAYWPRRWGGSVLITAFDETDVRDARFADEDIESAAIAGPTFSSLPGDDTADGTVAGAYVVINPAERDEVDEIVLSHEFTHVATAEYGGYEPLWLAEGVAEYVSLRGVEAVGGAGAAIDWEREVIEDALPGLKALPSDEGFYTQAADVYGVSWLAVRYLVRSIGIGRVADLYEDLARNGWDQAARDRILRSRTGFTEAGLFVALKKYRPRR